MSLSPRRLLWPTLATAVTLSILVALGMWQLHRLAWKNAILADIDHAEQSPPVPLGSGTPPRFTKVAVSGTLRPVRALYGADVRDTPGGRTAMGAQLLAVLDRASAPPLLVDLGWAPTDQPPPPISGPITVQGYIRAPDQPGWLSAEDSPAGRHFYTLNPANIGTALGVTNLAPFTLVALGPPVAGSPIPADALPRPPNNHFQYALTWFGLAASLLAVFGTWISKAGGRAPPQTPASLSRHD